jgi:hypothetical protein
VTLKCVARKWRSNVKFKRDDQTWRSNVALKRDVKGDARKWRSSVMIECGAQMWRKTWRSKVTLYLQKQHNTSFKKLLTYLILPRTIAIFTYVL